MTSVLPFISFSMATNMLCSEMFPIKETNDLQGAALYGIWSNGAQRVNPSQKRGCQAVNKEWRTGGSQPSPLLQPLPPSLQTISLIWHQLLPKKLQNLNCKVFWIQKCNKILAIWLYPLITQARLPFKRKVLWEFTPAYFTKVRCSHRLGIVWLFPLVIFI